MKSRRRELACGAMAIMAAAAALNTPTPAHASHAVGLGNVLTTSDGGQIFGFDIDQTGDDGVLSSAQTIDGQGDVLVSMETFDQDTGVITSTFAKYKGMRTEYSVAGIYAGDVALVTHYVTPKGTIYAKRLFDVMNPVTGNAFTGPWTAPLADINIQQAAENQATSTAVLFAIELRRQDHPVLIASDIARNTVSRVVKLDPNLFGVADAPQLGQFIKANEAVIALTPDAGAVHGKPPLNVLIDLKSGKSSQFDGYNLGPFHAGGVNGLAVDPNTGVAATTTELNAQVEFYDMTKKKGIVAVQLPCTGDTDELNNGSGIAVDPVNKLFLVTETYYCGASPDSAIVVYDESGNLIETITGFKFVIGEPSPALNPGKRMGWAFTGPKGVSQLQQFFY